MSVGFSENQIRILELLYKQGAVDPMGAILHNGLDSQHLNALSIGDRHALWNAVTDRSGEIFSLVIARTSDNTDDTSDLSKKFTDFERGLVSVRLRHQRTLWGRARTQYEEYVRGVSGLVNRLIRRTEVSEICLVRDRLWDVWQEWIEVSGAITDMDTCAVYGCGDSGDWAVGGLTGFIGRYCDTHAHQQREHGFSTARWNADRTSLRIDSFLSGQR